LLIGPQLRPQRIAQISQSLWMPAALQVLMSTLIFSLLAWIFLQQNLLASIVIGLAGSLSAMTLVIQQLHNQEQFATSYGQQTYSILLLHALLAIPRSEEHTSELQSRENLVCRLLLEKKNDPVPHHGYSFS